jgi:NADPH:quinone reductase-like Zn-dependent oxidoreductase
MNAMVLTGHGGFDKLVFHDDWPRPSPGPGEVLIRVAACGLNNTDVNTRTAWYSSGVASGTTGEALESANDDDAAWGGTPITFPRIQGADVAGRVADVVGGPQWPQFIDVLARGGRYTCSGAIAGPEVNFDLRTFYLRDLTFTGATVTAPDTFANLVGYIERDEIAPLLAGSWPLNRLVEAQQAFIAKQHVGNFVVEC